MMRRLVHGSARASSIGRECLSGRAHQGQPQRRACGRAAAGQSSGAHRLFRRVSQFYRTVGGSLLSFVLFLSLTGEPTTQFSHPTAGDLRRSPEPRLRLRRLRFLLRLGP